MLRDRMMNFLEAAVVFLLLSCAGNFGFYRPELDDMGGRGPHLPEEGLL